MEAVTRPRRMVRSSVTSKSDKDDMVEYAVG